jgi:hypothetical protein
MNLSDRGIHGPHKTEQSMTGGTVNNTETIICEGCGKELRIAHSAGDYNVCSDECRERAQREEAISDQVQEHRAAIEKLGRFGIVSWCEQDILTALTDAGAAPSPENIKAVREHFFVEQIGNRMTEIGFQILGDAIHELGLAKTAEGATKPTS